MRCTSGLAVVLIIALAGCGAGATDEVSSPALETTTKLVVYTVNYPLAYFAKRVGGDLVEVRFPAPADEDPAYWSPDPDTIAAYQGADLILLNGADYAGWVDRATLPGAKLVDTSGAFADRLIPLAGATTHSHGPEGDHEHTGWAMTTWLDPQLAIEQAQAVTTNFIDIRSDSEAEFKKGFGALESDLLTLDQRLAAASQSIGDTPLLFSHPVYQYLIRRYRLNAVEVHWEPNEAPDGRAWSDLETLLTRQPALWMLWEGEPIVDTINGLHELGVGSLLFDPCSNLPETGDYMTVMDANAGSLETIAETLNDQ